MKKLVVVVAILLSFAQSTFEKDEQFLDLIRRIMAEKNPDLRQLWYAMPGERNGEIIAFIQIRMSAYKSCGDDCKFTVYYEPLDKSQEVQTINTTWATKEVTISGLIPGKQYRVWACMESYKDQNGKIRAESCSWSKRIVKAADLSGKVEDADEQIVNRNSDGEATGPGKVTLVIRDKNADKKNLISHLLEMLLEG